MAKEKLYEFDDYSDLDWTSETEIVFGNGVINESIGKSDGVRRCQIRYDRAFVDLCFEPFMSKERKVPKEVYDKVRNYGSISSKPIEKYNEKKKQLIYEFNQKTLIMIRNIEWEGYSDIYRHPPLVNIHAYHWQHGDVQKVEMDRDIKAYGQCVLCDLEDQQKDAEYRQYLKRVQEKSKKRKEEKEETEKLRRMKRRAEKKGIPMKPMKRRSKRLIEKRKKENENELCLFI